MVVPCFEVQHFSYILELTQNNQFECFHTIYKIFHFINSMKTIYVDMVADMFHSGHVKFLKTASDLGDKLIVGLNSDKDVASYKRTPIISLKNRTIVIKACRYVNKVISPCPLIITKDFLQEHDIDLVVHAHPKNDTSYNFMYEVPIKLNKFKRIDYTPGISTTDIINKIK
jgi:cytidyltransferase-like protein